MARQRTLPPQLDPLLAQPLSQRHESSSNGVLRLWAAVMGSGRGGEVGKGGRDQRGGVAVGLVMFRFGIDKMS